jgi:hypothetical protein
MVCPVVLGGRRILVAGGKHHHVMIATIQRRTCQQRGPANRHWHTIT